MDGGKLQGETPDFVPEKRVTIEAQLTLAKWFMIVSTQLEYITELWFVSSKRLGYNGFGGGVG